MQNPIGLFMCSDPKENYNRIEIFRDSQVLIGLNDHGGIEILQDQISHNLALLEHKFNSFIMQSLSDCCHHRGNQIQRDGLIIMNENDVVQFQIEQQVWSYQLVIVKPSVSKNKDSKIKRMIQADNCFLENTLKCAICLEIFQRPVQLQCKHCFCGHCITILANSQLRCPTCRAYFTKVTNVEVLDKVCQSYLRKYPNKAKSIELQQLYEKEDRHCNEQEFCYFYPMNLIDAIDQQDLQEIDDILQQEQQQIQAQCISCHNQFKDFICQPGQQHVQCCNYWLPRRLLNEIENAQYKMFCQICKKYTCRFYYNNDCTSSLMVDLTEWIKCMNYHQKYFLSESILIKIQKYLKGISIDYIFNFVIQNSVQKEQFYLEGQQKRAITNQNDLILSESPLCYQCMKELIPQMVIKFFEFNRVICGIPNCENGIHCQQLYDENHDMNYNHICRRQVQRNLI